MTSDPFTSDSAAIVPTRFSRFKWTALCGVVVFIGVYSIHLWLARAYGNDETNGYSDISLSSSFDGSHFTTVRVTSSSMPPPTEFPNSFGNSVFYGDYSGLSAVDDAHPIWMDTRNPDLVLCPGTGIPGAPPAVCTFTEPNGLLANDQDIFTATVGVGLKK